MRVLTMDQPNGVRRYCDAKCHNSTKRHCNCICGGLLHGKGDSYARSAAAKTQMYLSRMYSKPSTVWLNPILIPQHEG